MKNKPQLWLSVLLLLFAKFSTAQTDPCGHDEWENYLFSQDSVHYVLNQNAHKAAVNYFRQKHPGQNYMTFPPPPTRTWVPLSATPGCVKAKYVIPVVVHIIHRSSDGTPGTGSNVSDAQVANAIAELNEDYSNGAGAPWPAVHTGIQFCLATKKPDGTSFSGITRQSHALTAHKRTQTAALFALDYFPSDQYLNIWVVADILDSTGVTSNVQGYATFPFSKFNGREGVVVKYEYFGDYTDYGSPLSIYSRGDVLSHEIGHYLGLYHPWHNGGCVGLTATTCYTQGDLCCDVPATDGPTQLCDTTLNTCTETYNSNPKDQKKNFMDYTDPACKNTFTPDQTNIMHATLTGERLSLSLPSNVNRLNLSGCFLSARFEGTSFVCAGDTVKYLGYEYDTTVTYTWRFYKGSSTAYLFSGNIDSIKFVPDTGFYRVELTISTGLDSVKQSIDSILEVGNCTSNIASTQGNWYFGRHAGMRFYQNSVYRDFLSLHQTNAGHFPEHLEAVEACVSISDTTGSLLFFGGHFGLQAARDFNLYDAEGFEMTGSPVGGNFTTAQGAVAFPVPNNSAGNLYYLVTDDMTYHRWHVIDLSKTSVTRGEIVHRNKRVNLDDSFVAEYLTAIPHCNGINHWLVGIVMGHDSNYLTFYVDNADTTIGFTKVRRYGFEVTPFNSEGAIKFSPDGNFFSFYNKIYKFDRATANITLMYEDNYYLFRGSWGSTFSSNGRFLYKLEWRYLYDFGLYQYDLLSSSSDLGKTLVTKVNFHKFLQSGPDGKIYLSAVGQKYVSVINKPNEKDYGNNECDYQEVGVVLADELTDILCHTSLPNMVDAKRPHKLEAKFRYKISRCDSVSFYPERACAISYLWDFGDGSTSTSKFGEHIYQDTGWYAVSLNADGVRAYDTIHIGFDKPKIVSDTNICSLGTPYQFEIGSLDRSVTYTWSAVGGAVAPNSVYPWDGTVTWSGSGTLKLVAYQSNTGCKDSMIQTATVRNAVLTNFINLNYNWICPSDTTEFIGGYDATSYDPITGYEWYKSTDGVNYSKIDGATSKSLRPFVEMNSDDTIYVRKAKTAHCSSMSNEITAQPSITSNAIGGIVQPCLPTSSFDILGNVPGVYYNTTTYQWQTSPDSINWTNLSGTNTYRLLGITLGTDSLWYRRIVTGTTGSISCSVPSKAIKVKHYFRITTQPKDKGVCGAGQPYTFSVAISNPTGLTVQYQWQMKTSGSGTWMVVGGNSNSYSNVTTTGFSSGDSVRCAIITGCGTLYTKVAVLYINNSPITITTHPANDSIATGDTIILSSSATPSAGLLYQWQQSDEKGINWTNMEDYTSNPLMILGADICQNKHRYRVLISNGCDEDTSNSALIKVGINPKYDAWMRDAWQDTAFEPFDSLGYDIFHSPDIWNRILTDGFDSIRHQNPVLHSPFYNQQNYCYTKVRNKGTLASEPAELFLYWSYPSTGLTWDKSWKYSSGNMFPDAITGYLYPLGGEINNTPIYVPSITPGDSLIIETPWNPPVAHHYTFTKKLYNVPFGSPKFQHLTIKHNGVSMLARLQTCPSFPFGMHSNETSNIVYNVSENNNIVIRTSQVVQLFELDTTTNVTHNYVVNNTQTNGCFDVSLIINDTTFFRKGFIKLHLDSTLGIKWHAGGTLGSGYTMIDSSTLRVDSNVNIVNIRNLCLDVSQGGLIAVEFGLKPGASDFSVAPYRFDLHQFIYNTSRNLGGVNYEVFALGGLSPFSIPTVSWYKGLNTGHIQVGNTVGQNSQFGENDGNTPKTPAINPNVSIVTGGFSVYPNPFSAEFNIVYYLASAQTVSFELYDVAGRSVMTFVPGYQQSGNHKVVIPMSEMAEGIYYLRTVLNGKPITTKLIHIKR